MKLNLKRNLLKDQLKKLKEKPDVDIALPKEIKDIFQEFLNQQDDALKSFLDAGADKILQDIETMEDYRRALKATKLKQEEKELMGKQAPTKKFLLELLRKGRIEEFNDVPRFKFSEDLSYANLSDANLSDADLSSADLSTAKLFGADLSSADLSSATLQNSIIIGARYRDNDLKCVDADFKDAIIDDENLTMRLSSNKNTKNVPPAVKNKRELREKLEERGFSRDVIIGEFLSRSSLPD
jgi:Pentapeptide repeats (8 copies)